MSNPIVPIPEVPQDNEYRDIAWGFEKPGEDCKPLYVNRPKVGDTDIKIDMLYSGICHTDIHFAKEMPTTVFPVVPGHELLGRVVEVGSKVTKVKVGDIAGVGCLVDSCRNCGNCNRGDEQYCEKGHVLTYNGMKTFDHVGGNKDLPTYGGYTASHTCDERFVFKIPESLPIEKAAPLLCAGITMYDPLKHWGATKEGAKMTIGVVGIGGLGTMGIKLAKAMGHRVVAISRSDAKKDQAMSKGADAYVAI